MEEGRCGLLGATLSSERLHQSGMDFELQGPGQDPTEKGKKKSQYVQIKWFIRIVNIINQRSYHICYIVDSWVLLVRAVTVVSDKSVSVCVCQISIHLLLLSLLGRTLFSATGTHNYTE